MLKISHQKKRTINFSKITKRHRDVFSNYFHKAHAAWALFGENRSGQLVCVPKMSGAILSERRSPDLTPISPTTAPAEGAPKSLGDS